MLHDVLTTLCATPQLAGIIVVSGDPVVAKLATLFDARVVGDVVETGVNAAVQQGLRTLDPSSAGALIVPADVPFATRCRSADCHRRTRPNPLSCWCRHYPTAEPTRLRCAGRI